MNDISIHLSNDIQKLAESIQDNEIINKARANKQKVVFANKILKLYSHKVNSLINTLQK